MTLNGVMVLILRCFTQFGSFGAHYVKVVEYSPTICNKNLVRIIQFIAICNLWRYSQVTEIECIIDRHMCDIDPLRDSLQGPIGPHQSTVLSTD